MQKLNFFGLVIFLLFSLSLFGQEEIGDLPIDVKPSDRVVISVFSDVWSDLPEGVETSVINRGLSIDLLQDFPVGNFGLSVAAGLGYSGRNIYTPESRFRLPDMADITDESDEYFDFIPVNENLEVDKSKLSLNYIQVPLELRWRSQGENTFRIHAGGSFGYLLGSHTKYVGQEEIFAGLRDTRKKESKLDNIENYLVGAYLRLGYKSINAMVYMPITNVFKANASEEATFIGFGLSFVSL